MLTYWPATKVGEELIGIPSLKPWLFWIICRRKEMVGKLKKPF
jgi:hypothetical protein